MSAGSDELYLKKCLSKYKNKEQTKGEVLRVCISYGDLKPNLQPHIFNDGSRKDLLTLKGTIPVTYRRATYNIPVCLYLMETHPLNPPLCYVRPTASMEIKVGKHVDSGGRVYLPYLHEWSHPESDLLGLIEVMRIVFGQEPPVFSKSPSSRQHSQVTIRGPGRSDGRTQPSQSPVGPNTQLSDRHLTRIFNRLSLKVKDREVKKLSRGLGLTEDEIRGIQDECPDDPSEQAYQAFLKWRETEGDVATLEDLRYLLEAIGMEHLAEGVQFDTLKAAGTEDTCEYDDECEAVVKIRTCLAVLRDVVGEDIPEMELLRVAAETDYDISKALDCFFSCQQN